MNTIGKTKKTAFMGVMLAVVIVLTSLEHMLQPIPFLPPNVKLGLSNIVTMYCVFFIGKTHAVTLNALKAVFVFLMRGPMAGMLSLCGGLLAIGVIVLLLLIFDTRASYVIISIAGATAHNMGQIAAYSLIMKTGLLLFYIPALLISGVLMGVVTGTLLKVILPALNSSLNRYDPQGGRLSRNKPSEK